MFFVWNIELTKSRNPLPHKKKKRKQDFQHTINFILTDMGDAEHIQQFCDDEMHRSLETYY